MPRVFPAEKGGVTMLQPVENQSVRQENPMPFPTRNLRAASRNFPPSEPAQVKLDLLRCMMLNRHRFGTAVLPRRSPDGTFRSLLDLKLHLL